MQSNANGIHILFSQMEVTAIQVCFRDLDLGLGIGNLKCIYIYIYIKSE